MEEEAKVRYYETNEGREVSQGFAGFQGNNVLLLLGAVGLSLILSQGVDNLNYPTQLFLSQTGGSDEAPLAGKHQSSDQEDQHRWQRSLTRI
jgi:hypothetical protein